MRARTLACCAVIAVLLPNAASTASRHADPDWPCAQRLVPMLSAGLFWAGPDVEKAGDWRQQPNVAELVRKAAPRKTTAEQGETMIREFASGVHDNRPQVLTLVFAGLLDETNRLRAELIERIKALMRRQRELSDIAVRLGDELRAIPTDASGEAAERRRDLEQRRFYAVKSFDDAQRTLRYVCEAPVQLEARLGAYARALQESLD